ncbi:hypothetical protein C8F04DRAFT_1360877 [Mycena alexandri]|uniref:Uncharacterized protein n=1 Tax=Mycena alexandri TaxID=1745969 RepID=A0AAD6SSI9_9AGAR|nr:hypothetical protein C8F04DRAFT_1360877 [Mycena alexandri]
MAEKGNVVEMAENVVSRLKNHQPPRLFNSASQARAWLGLGLEKSQPEPTQARPKPGLPGRAGPGTSLRQVLLVLDQNLWKPLFQEKRREAAQKGRPKKNFVIFELVGLKNYLFEALMSSPDKIDLNPPKVVPTKTGGFWSFWTWPTRVFSGVLGRCKGAAWYNGNQRFWSEWSLGKPEIAGTRRGREFNPGQKPSCRRVLVGITLIGRVPHCSASAVRA